MSKMLLKLKHIFAEPIVGAAIVFTLFAGYFAFISSANSFPDPDTWYHLKITEMIIHQGPVMNFPWLTQTNLTQSFVDHHLLYHYALYPFILFFGDLIGGKIATVLFAALLIALIYYILRKEKVEYSWLFLLLAASNLDFIFRILLTKASAPAVLFLILGVWATLRHRWVWLFLINIIYVSLHGGFILLPFATAVYVACSAFVDVVIQNPVPLKLRPYWQVIKKFIKTCFTGDNAILLLATLFGIAVGVLLNPYHLKLFPFLQEQLVQIGIFNKSTTIKVGNEWYPLSFPDFITRHFFIVYSFILASVLFFAEAKKINKRELYFFILSLVFFILTARFRRFAEYFVPFAVLFAGFAAYQLKTQIQHLYRDLRSQALAVQYMVKLLFLAALALFIFIDFQIGKDLYSSYHTSRDFNYMKGVATWLRNSVPPNTVIFQTDWSDFPGLFYFDDQHYYITGLDPTFMYDYNRDQYLLYEDIVRGIKTDNLRQTIQEKFHSSVIVLNHNASQFDQNLRNNPDFIRTYEDSDGIIYIVNPNHE